MQNFWLQNISFVIYIFAAFAIFAVAWLHLDADKVRKQRLLLSKFGGFGLVALSFLVRIFAQVDGVFALSSYALSVLGLAVLAWSMFQEPVLSDKISDLVSKGNASANSSLDEKDETEKSDKKHKMHVVLPQVLLLLPLLAGALGLATSYMYWRVFKKGRVSQYKWLFVATLLLGASYVIYGLEYLGGSSIIIAQQVFGAYGIAWLIQHGLLIGATVCFAYWFWKFVRFRVHPELFISFAFVAVALSTGAAFVYSSFLYSSAQNDLFAQLGKDVKVLELAVTNLEDNAMTAATLLSKSGDISRSLQKSDYKTLYKAALLYAKETPGIDSIVVTDESAQILVHTGNQSQIGRSLSDDNLMIYALKEKKPRVSVVTEPTVLADDIVIRAVHPVLSTGGELIGTVRTEVVIDDAFVDKVKSQTGLEVSVYAAERRSATTILAADSLNRRENTVDTNPAVIEDVLKQGKVHSGLVDVINEPFHGAYAPLLNTNSEVIGMLFVGRPESLLIEAVNNSLFATFFMSILGSLLAMLPAYFIARRIERGGV